MSTPMTPPPDAVAALAEALEPIARDVREWSRIKAVHDINTTGAAKMILAHLPGSWRLVDMGPVSDALTVAEASEHHESCDSWCDRCEQGAPGYAEHRQTPHPGCDCGLDTVRSVLRRLLDGGPR